MGLHLIIIKSKEKLREYINIGENAREHATMYIKGLISSYSGAKKEKIIFELKFFLNSELSKSQKNSSAKEEIEYYLSLLQ